MQFALLIYGDEAAGNERYAGMSEEEQAADMGRWFAYTEELKSSGVHVAGEALHPTETASTVKTPNGERMVTDGPFAETKEQLGGFYIIDVPSKEDAVEWAAKIPSAPYGSVEVREIMTFDQAPS
jgi:hypothetical protein